MSIEFWIIFIDTAECIPQVALVDCLGSGLFLGQCSPGRHGLSSPSGMAYARAKKPNKINFMVGGTILDKLLSMKENHSYFIAFYILCLGKSFLFLHRSIII